MSRIPFHACAAALAVLGVCTPVAAQGEVAPASAEEVQALRREIQELRDQVQALRDQVAGMSAPARVLPVAPPAAPAPPEAAAPPAPVTAAPTRSQNLMNPAISAVFQTIGNTSLKHESEANGFDLSEAEIALQSVVDPYAKVDLFLSFPAGGSPEVEEGFVSTLALPHSLQLKGGRFKNAFGKWNTLHTHAFFTVDRPGAFVNFFGEESLTTDGLSLSVLIPNPWDLYLEATTEIGTALADESFNGSHHDLTYLEHLAASFNTSSDSTLEAGLSAARGKAGFVGPTPIFGPLTPMPGDKFDSMVEGVDLTYKWKPLQLNVYRSFLWQTEVLRSRRDLDVFVFTPSTALVAETVSSLGGYSYVEWQFAKRWKGGLRFDLSGFPDSETARESSSSAVVRFQPSEFQELRFEVKHTRRNDEAAQRFDDVSDDTRVFFEWIPVIGAHGAHKY